MEITRVFSTAHAGASRHAAIVTAAPDTASGAADLRLTGVPEGGEQLRTRVHAALANSGLGLARRPIHIDISSAVPELVGSGVDLAVALAVLGASGAVPTERLARVLVVAELGLDGSLGPVNGTYASALVARDNGFTTLVVAPGNAAEAALVEGLTVIAPESLPAVAAWLHGELDVAPVAPVAHAVGRLAWSDLAGHPRERRLLEIAAAGGHHLFLTGGADTATTMVAKRLPLILPPLTTAEREELTALHSLQGALRRRWPQAVSTPPLAAPHHNGTVQSLLGPVRPMGPGRLALAHQGVLLISDAPQWTRSRLDAIRKVLDEREVHLRIGERSFRYPVRTQVVMTADPCPYGRTGSGDGCAPFAHAMHLAQIDRTFLGHFALHADPTAPDSGAAEQDRVEPVEEVRGRVLAARAAAAARWATSGVVFRTNHDASGPLLGGPRWGLPAPVLDPLTYLWERGEVTERGYVQVLRVAWTLADLAGRDRPTTEDVEAAAALRRARP